MMQRVGEFPIRKIFVQGAASRSFSTHGAPPQTAPVHVYISNNTNPFFNLAYEEFLFRTKSANSNIFFWWRNEPSIIIGRFQNPWKEVHMPAMEQRGVHLVRRKSGGGTVYQDLGNSIFSFIGL
jgi:lipoate-protein ligase A